MFLKYLELFFEFLKIGLFTFGGGYAMIPIVAEVVDLGWISSDQFNNMVGLSEVTPGPIALNMATFVGSTHAGFLGGILATIGVVLPSFVIICIVAAILSKYSENKYIKSALRGTMYVAIGLIISISVTMTLQVLTTFGTSEPLQINWNTLIVFGFVLLGYILMWISTSKKPGPIQTIFMSLIVGLCFSFGYFETILFLILLVAICLFIRRRKTNN